MAMRWQKLRERKEHGNPENIRRVYEFMTAKGMKVKKGRIYVMREAKEKE